MSYIVEQKSGKNIYIYEAEGYWDKEKQQARQRRKYLGKKDPVTGEIIKAKSTSPKRCMDFGHVHVAKTVSDEIGLTNCLKNTFKSDYKKIIDLTMFQLLEARAMHMQKEWAEGCFIKNKISSQNISKIISKIGNSEQTRFDFFKQWAQRQSKGNCTWLDITSFSSYSKGLDFCEWGYNRDKERIPQVNLGVLVNDTNNLPFHYQLYPGSIADVSTLEGTIKAAKELNANINTLILDRGYYSINNIKTLLKFKLNFIMPLPFSRKLASDLLEKSNEKLASIDNCFSYRKQILSYHQESIEIAGTKINAVVFLDEEKQRREKHVFLNKLIEFEDLVKHRSFSSEQEAKDSLSEQMQKALDFFHIKVDGKNEGLSLTRNTAIIEKHISKMGRFILLTNDLQLTHDQILSRYRHRDGIEKIFDSIKNEINIDRLRIHSRMSMEGRIFIAFLAVILYTAILQKLKQTELIKDYSVNKLFMELKKIRLVELNNGKKLVSETTKRQRIILGKLDITIPEKPCY